MPNLDPGTVVAQGECADCGKPVQVKLNKNGIAYYFCKWPDTATGEPCSHHQKWGRAASNRMQRDYLAARRQSKEEPDDERPADLQEQPEPATARRGGDDDGDIFASYG